MTPPLPTDFEASSSLIQAIEHGEIPTSVRLNCFKPYAVDLLKLPNEDIVPWCPNGRYLPSRPSFTLDPLFASGTYYVQEASSMVVGEIARFIIDNSGFETPIAALDLCAAPGGKSTHLSEVLLANNKANVLVSNEVIGQRAGVLVQSIVKWGLGNTIVSSADAALFGTQCSEMFDIAVIDAPCSGEGMFRRDANARLHWSLDNVMLCASRQRRIVADVWQSIKPGGVLIYSTCTFNRHENQENVEWICRNLGAEVIELDWLEQYNVTKAERGDGYNFYSDKLRGEGFYLCALRVNGNAQRQKYSKPFKIDKKLYSVVDSITRTTPLIVNNERRLGYNSETMYHLVDRLNKARIRILYAGVDIGGLDKRGDLIPSHPLALYYDYDSQGKSVELSYDNAIAYLRREPIPVALFQSNGLFIVTYQNAPLGFAKVIGGSRINNLYPTNWRITNPNITI